ncbi:NAD(P)/FAD-dependent oxidoreductase [Nocardia sp. alder85J]|uniref:NAD(P)/FAD-dependent oxidoreductase n=1 Tax=Nocardia sp. alder85J TaxID=2862949 RepID=UPI001CD4986C|nr:FAD-dependent oxidoreductase [Nocardia sp. alder85J]MCX4091052.1 FAD-dependent oxidoreductase [Nocardia sp. alder85J]
MTGSVVVVGGGIAGVSTVAALRSGGFTGEITLVDAGEFPYDRPPLSKDFLAGSKSLAEIALQPPQWFDDNKIRLLTRTTAIALRAGAGEVELSGGGPVRADRVVLATGGRAARPPIPGGDSDRVHVLRTAEDAQRLRAALGPGIRLLVVGAGLIGAETASTAVDLGCEVTLVDPVSPPLAGVVGTEIAAWLHEMHTARGISLRRAGVAELRETAAGIEATFTAPGPVAPRTSFTEPDSAVPQRLFTGADSAVPQTFDAVVLGVGMVPDTALAAAAGLDIDRGILVDRRQVTSHPAVLAVGDPARVRDGGVLLPRTEHWEAAQRDGQRAAATILGAPVPVDGIPWFWTDRHHRHVEAIGSMSGADRVVHRGVPGESPFAAFGLRDGRVIAAVAVDDSKAVRAARRLADGGIPVDPDRLADPGTDLRKLLRG